MIPEIHDKFIVMNWLREQKVDYDENFEKLPVRHQTNIVALNGTIESFVNKLKSEIFLNIDDYQNESYDSIDTIPNIGIEFILKLKQVK